MTSKLEGVLQKNILRWCKSHRDIWIVNIVGSACQETGIPDLIVCKSGKFIGVELKRPDKKGKTSVAQQVQLSRIREAGGVGMVIDSFDEFVKLIEEI